MASPKADAAHSRGTLYLSEVTEHSAFSRSLFTSTQRPRSSASPSDLASNSSISVLSKPRRRRDSMWKSRSASLAQSGRCLAANPWPLPGRAEGDWPATSLASGHYACHSPISGHRPVIESILGQPANGLENRAGINHHFSQGRFRTRVEREGGARVNVPCWPRLHIRGGPARWEMLDFRV